MRKLSKREEKELREKLEKDGETLDRYKWQLKNQRKEYSQTASCFSLTGRRSRALALGECVLQAIEQLRKLAGEKKLLDGTLFWNILEERVLDTDGRKGFRYTAIYHVKSDEQAYTDEFIHNEIEETAEKILNETGEMFGINVKEWLEKMDEEERMQMDLIPPFEPDVDPALEGGAGDGE